MASGVAQEAASSEDVAVPNSLTKPSFSSQARRRRQRAFADVEGYTADLEEPRDADADSLASLHRRYLVCARLSRAHHLAEPNSPARAIFGYRLFGCLGPLVIPQQWKIAAADWQREVVPALKQILLKPLGGTAAAAAAKAAKTPMDDVLQRKYEALATPENVGASGDAQPKRLLPKDLGLPEPTQALRLAADAYASFVHDMFDTVTYCKDFVKNNPGIPQAEHKCYAERHCDAQLRQMLSCVKEVRAGAQSGDMCKTLVRHFNYCVYDHMFAANVLMGHPPATKKMMAALTAPGGPLRRPQTNKPSKSQRAAKQPSAPK
jgi:hypothetical protein